jgi:hypothetical protein
MIILTKSRDFSSQVPGYIILDVLQEKLGNDMLLYDHFGEEQGLFFSGFSALLY